MPKVSLFGDFTLAGPTLLSLPSANNLPLLRRFREEVLRRLHPNFARASQLLLTLNWIP